MKIGVVNDMPLAVKALRHVLAERPDFEVVWEAHDGQQALDLCVARPPDVVLMDLVMPNLDGVAATRAIMARAPCAILVVTSDIGSNVGRVYEAMGAGALDAVDLPVLSGLGSRGSIAALIAKIDRVAEVVRARADLTVPVASAAAPAGQDMLVAIGASAGGPGALVTILSRLPRDLDAAIVIIQHVDAAFAQGMAKWLDQQSALPVRVAQEGARPERGVVLLAGTDDHLYLNAARTFGYTPDPADMPYRPSVDVFFQSVVARWPARAIGVLLTGMGRDGAQGLKAMRAKGYLTIAQDQASCAVYGMPKAAAAIDAASAILPLERIADVLAEAVAGRAVDNRGALAEPGGCTRRTPATGHAAKP